MKVSIITPTYNSAKTLRDAMDSVFAQEHADIEYIIVDGKSTDKTLDIVHSYGNKVARVFSEHDRGIYDAMNKGIRAATGDIIGILNSDDFLASPHVLSAIVSAFEEDPHLDGIHGDLFYVDSTNTNRVIRYWHSGEYRPNAFLKGWHPAHPTFYVRREIYDKYGVFDLRFPLSGDFELMLRLFECCNIRTRHLSMIMVRMRTGGATSHSFFAVMRGIHQCNRAFRANGLRPRLFYPFYRLLPKLLQYVRRAPVASLFFL